MTQFYYMHLLYALQQNQYDIQLNLIHIYQNDWIAHNTIQIHYIVQYFFQTGLEK